MNKYKGIIFDLDGVICSTDKFHYEAWKKMSDRMQIPFDEKINNRLRGVSRMESLEIVLEQYHGVKLNKKEKENLAEEKNENYKMYLQNMNTSDLSEEVKSTLMSLKNKGFLLAIGSSSKNAKMILNKIGLSNFWDAISDGTNISQSKPDPEVFLKAAKYLKLEPEECLVVEDAITGVDAAIAGKFDSAAIGDARNYEKATYKLRKFSDLLEIC